MNRKKDIKARTLQSLITRAMNKIEKEITENGSSDELVLAKSFLTDALRIVTMLHQGATCINTPPVKFQVMQENIGKPSGYVAGWLQGEKVLTIDCEVKV